MTTPRIDVFDEGGFELPSPPQIQDNGGTAIPAQTVGPSGQTAPDTALPRQTPTSASSRRSRTPTAPPERASVPSLENLPTLESLGADQQALFELTQAPTREGYNPDIQGIPLNVNEANLASFWLRVNTQNNPSYIDPVTGRPVRVGPQATINPATGEPTTALEFAAAQALAGTPLTLEEQQVLEFREQVEFAIEDVNQQAADFRASFTQSIIDTQREAALKDLDFQADARLEQIKRGQTGTPESRAAAIDQVNEQFRKAREDIEAEGREDTQTLQTILRLGERLTTRSQEFDAEVDEIETSLP